MSTNAGLSFSVMLHMCLSWHSFSTIGYFLVFHASFPPCFSEMVLVI